MARPLNVPSRERLSSLNPFKCSGTPLLPEILLAAKLLALLLLWLGYARSVPEPFLPFVPVFDSIGHPAAVRVALQLFTVAGALGILFNRWVRASCLLLGGAIAASVLSRRVSYYNNAVFCGVFFLMRTSVLRARPAQGPGPGSAVQWTAPRPVRVLKAPRAVQRAPNALAPPLERRADARYLMPFCAQKPLTQTLAGLQQSAAVVHFSWGAEHMPLCGVLEHSRVPPGPLGSREEHAEREGAGERGLESAFGRSVVQGRAHAQTFSKDRAHGPKRGSRAVTPC